MKLPRYLSLAILALCIGGATASATSIIQIPAASFVAGSGLITFSEKALGTVNPTYVPADYGGGIGSPTVTFEGFFSGQSLGATCGGVASGCVLGTPSNPLTLDGASPNTFIVGDGANPTSPVLSGTPTFNGPISMLFDVDMAGVGLDGGFFNAIGGTAIKAFARDGTLLGQVTNGALAIEFLGLVTDDGSEKIAGLQFSIVGPEPAGFAIDNVRFGRTGQVVVPPNPIPEPTTMLLLGSGLLGLPAMIRRKRASRS